MLRMVNLTPPFGPTLNTAVIAVRELENDISARHAARPEEWEAFQVDEIDGYAIIALALPDSLRVSSLEVDGFELKGGPRLVALFGPPVEQLTCIADNVPVTVPVARL